MTTGRFDPFPAVAVSDLAASMPFDDAFFRGAICTWAIHHFSNLPDSFQEINRVLQSGSRFVIFTALPEQMKDYWLNAYFPKMMEAAIRQMPDAGTIFDALRQTGFRLIGCESFLIQPGLEDLFLYAGKHRPELYLNGQVRQGISSFALWAGKDEVEKGLAQLREDIASGAFGEKIEDYCSRNGDCLFIVAEKSKDH